MDSSTDAQAHNAETAFLAAFPEYAGTRELDLLRRTDYSRLDRLRQVYLDYTGAGLYAERQIHEHMELLDLNLLGNPHSQSPASQASTAFLESGRRRVLDFFRADPDEYVAIFTANATAALKLVGEAYPFSPGDQYLLTFDNHNSVNGIREFARGGEATTTYIPLSLPELRVEEASLKAYFSLATPGGHNLFAYPAQSNFSGVQHPLEWIERAKALGWDVLLDAAAFTPTNQLDLTRWHPDFVSLSFYKMLGYPTGVGCLLARREALAKLTRPWFSGGTITVASVQGDRYFLADGSSAFEDGTPDFAAIPRVQIGLLYLESVGVDRIHVRCRCLTSWLIQQLQLLRHRDGAPLVVLYGPSTADRRGATVTMNLYDSCGQIIDHRRVEEAAVQHSISLRTGCFCNPGVGESALGLSRHELVQCFNQERVIKSAHLTVDDFRLCVDGKSTGAVRVSFGIASNFSDALRFLEFVRGFAEPRLL